MLYVASVFLPLVGAAIAGFFGRALGDRAAAVVSCTFLGLAMLAGFVVFYDVAFAGETRQIELLTWIDSGAFEVAWSLRFDTLTAVMVFVVTTVSFLVHVYSIGYMERDPHIPRFFAYLSLFTSSTAIGLAILVVYFRNRGSIAVEDVNMMKG